MVSRLAFAFNSVMCNAAGVSSINRTVGLGDRNIRQNGLGCMVMFGELQVTLKTHGTGLVFNFSYKFALKEQLADLSSVMFVYCYF